MYSLTFYHPNVRKLHGLAVPSYSAALVTLGALRSVGYLCRLWQHPRKRDPRLVR